MMSKPFRCNYCIVGQLFGDAILLAIIGVLFWFGEYLLASFFLALALFSFCSLYKQKITISQDCIEEHYIFKSEKLPIKDIKLVEEVIRLRTSGPRSAPMLVKRIRLNGDRKNPYPRSPYTYSFVVELLRQHPDLPIERSLAKRLQQKYRLHSGFFKNIVDREPEDEQYQRRMQHWLYVYYAAVVAFAIYFLHLVTDIVLILLRR